MHGIGSGVPPSVGAPPSPSSVPLPGPLIPRTQRAERIVFELARTRNPELQMFLENATAVLLNSREKVLFAPELSRQLPEPANLWLQSQDLRLCQLLACYADDFKVYKDGRSRRIECNRQHPEGAYAYRGPGDKGSVLFL
eukprot:TRINITY_DN20316_c0_g2_i1.p1 TRINITY_DN20316_c0_g2~~TRINITY_DN20316_c0_g2_i1.p1  ORF type:complete len:153 (+),score=7.44 TRINITY_DN20316_c0_g2_i1:40-459(+)